MLWYKSWLDTRWRFLIGLALIACSAATVVFTYPRVLELLPLAANTDVGGPLGRRIREVAELAREYRGFVWSQGFGQNLTELATLFAVLLGTGGLVSQPSGTGMLFTLSMPVSRAHLVAVRAATGLAELFALTVTPAIVIPLLSPSIGEHYSVFTGLGHAVCLFAAAGAFFSLALLLSTIFTDMWRPLLIALGLAIAIWLVEQFTGGPSRHGIFGVMSGGEFFHTGHLPWAGLLVAVIASAAMLYAASVSLRRRDF
jgi:hypothetical protein